MDNQVKTLWAISDMARDLKCLPHQILYVIEVLDLKCIDVVGGSRVFSNAQKDTIADELKRIEERKPKNAV